MISAKKGSTIIILLLYLASSIIFVYGANPSSPKTTILYNSDTVKPIGGNGNNQVSWTLSDSTCSSQCDMQTLQRISNQNPTVTISFTSNGQTYNMKNGNTVIPSTSLFGSDTPVTVATQTYDMTFGPNLAMGNAGSVQTFQYSDQRGDTFYVPKDDIPGYGKPIIQTNKGVDLDSVNLNDPNLDFSQYFHQVDPNSDLSTYYNNVITNPNNPPAKPTALNKDGSTTLASNSGDSQYDFLGDSQLYTSTGSDNMC